MYALRRLMPLVLLCVTAASCGDESGSAIDLDAGRPDITVPMPDGARARDMFTGPDASLGQACDDADDCPSGFCVAHDDGRRVCTERCGSDDDCPSGWLCRQVTNTGPDVTFICIPEASPCGGADLSADPDNCGACDRRCDYAFATALCLDGDCEMDACLDGHHDVDGLVENGCEYGCTVTLDGMEGCDAIDNDCDGTIDEDFDLTSDPENCGSCARRCDLPNAEAACSDGACRLVACAPGFADADGDVGNGCEGPDCISGAEQCDGADNDCDGLIDEDFDFESSPRTCGDCATECRPDNAEPACVRGQCEIEACRDGAVDLDGDPANGCEYLCRGLGEERCNEIDDDCDGAIDEGFVLATDRLNCGACGVACVFENAAALCVDGRCGVGDCLDGFVDLDGLPGCEYACQNRGEERCNEIDDDCDGTLDEGFDLDGDLQNCGACGEVCRFDNAAAACVDGACEVGDCQPDFVDLDGEPGCEYGCRDRGEELCNEVDDDCDGETDEGFDLTTDGLNCGLCGAVCAFENADASCVDGACVEGECRPGFVDRDGAPGCEYACQIRGDELCNEADDDCDGAIDEGFDLTSDAVNCGVCGTTCAVPNADSACVDGVCRVGDCQPGFHDIDGLPGCEYACVFVGMETCDGVVDEDCDGRIDEDFDFQNNPDTCGNCFTGCNYVNAEGLCIEGVCQQGDCAAGFLDLDGIPGCEYACVPSDDGIETCNEADDDCDGQIDEGLDLDADPDNCGRCGRICDGPQAITECDEGDCRLIDCEPGFHDVDADPDTGCEYACDEDGAETCDEEDDDCDGVVDEGYDLTSDVQNCGLCGLACAFLNAVPQCLDGRCAAGDCRPGFVDVDDLPGCEYACVPTDDGVEACNGADDDCDGLIDERAGDPPLPECEVDRSGEFLVEANPSQQIIGGILPIDFIPAFLTLDVQPPDVSGSMDGPDGRPILYDGVIAGDDMDLDAFYTDPAGLEHTETWEVTWDGVDRFSGLMTDRIDLPGLGLLDVVVWNVTGTRR